MSSVHSAMDISGRSMTPVTEDQLLSQIAYYRARLADIEKAPAQSRHREAGAHVSARLQECQYRLAQLRSQTAANRQR